MIKWLFFIAVIAAAAMAITGYKVRGKTIEEHFTPFFTSPIVKEGVRDIRTLVGEGLKAAGEAVSEDVTDSERKELENVLKQELSKGKEIIGAPNQMALPPETQTVKPAPMTGAPEKRQ